MVAIAHVVAVLCYLGAAALAAAPFARPVAAPRRWVVGVLAVGVACHALALAAYARGAGQAPFTGLGPALSFAGLLLAATLLAVELLARDVSLALVAAPLAALPTGIAAAAGLAPAAYPGGVQGALLAAHISLSFLGIAAFGTAAAAGMVYLVERRELRSRRFGPLFRLFPPLETLDRVNHVAAIAGGLALTLGTLFAVTYSIAYHQLNPAQMLWGTFAWLGASAVAVGRLARGWRARRAAIISSVAFAVIVALYLALRVGSPEGGRFL
jgi:ABC-type uncharacterized transport system permease subunit